MKVAIDTLQSRRSNVIRQLAGIHLFINGIALTLRLMAFPDHLMFWFGPALLLIYLLYSRTNHGDRTPPPGDL